MQYMKSAITNQKLIGGVKKDIIKVTFIETVQAPEEQNIRVPNPRTTTHHQRQQIHVP